MELHPEAQMADITIIEVPHQWRGLAPLDEIGLAENSNLIKLIHKPTGIQYCFEVEADGLGKDEVAECRAKAKLAFIHELHGEAELFK